MGFSAHSYPPGCYCFLLCLWQGRRNKVQGLGTQGNLLASAPPTSVGCCWPHQTVCGLADLTCSESGFFVSSVLPEAALLRRSPALLTGGFRGSVRWRELSEDRKLGGGGQCIHPLPAPTQTSPMLQLQPPAPLPPWTCLQALSCLQSLSRCCSPRTGPSCTS